MFVKNPFAKPVTSLFGGSANTQGKLVNPFDGAPPQPCLFGGSANTQGKLVNLFRSPPPPPIANPPLPFFGNPPNTQRKQENLFDGSPPLPPLSPRPPPLGRAPPFPIFSFGGNMFSNQATKTLDGPGKNNNFAPSGYKTLDERGFKNIFCSNQQKMLQDREQKNRIHSFVHHQCQPFPFLSISQGKIVFHDQSKEFLKSIKQQYISFILNYGSPNSGKSFFANEVLLNGQEIFKINYDHQKKQPKVYLSRKEIKNELGASILLLDWQGQPHKGLLQILLLICSTIINNKPFASRESQADQFKLVEDLVQIAYNLNYEFNQVCSIIMPEVKWVFKDNKSTYPFKNLQAIFGLSNETYQGMRKIQAIDHFRKLFSVESFHFLPYPYRLSQTHHKKDILQNQTLSLEYIQKTKVEKVNLLKNIQPKKIGDITLNVSLVISLIQNMINYDPINKSKNRIKSIWNQTLEKNDQNTIRNTITQIPKELLLPIQNLQRVKKDVISRVKQLKQIKFYNDKELQEYIEYYLNKLTKQKFDKERIGVDKLDKKIKQISSEIKKKAGNSFQNFMKLAFQAKVKLLDDSDRVDPNQRPKYLEKVNNYFDQLFETKLIEISKEKQDILSQKKKLFEQNNSLKQKINEIQNEAAVFEQQISNYQIQQVPKVECVIESSDNAE